MLQISHYSDTVSMTDACGRKRVGQLPFGAFYRLYFTVGGCGRLLRLAAYTVQEDVRSISYM